VKTVVADVLARFLAAFPTGEDACLFADQVSAPDATSIERAPFWTVLVRGRHDGQEGPHALVLLTVPSRSADAPEVLEFAVRRARANKAPYFVTWTLRDAIVWQTPKPGVPAARDSLEKLHDYADLFEVSTADQGQVGEPARLKIADRGREIIHDLERLLKDQALGLVRIDATYFVGRLLDAVHSLLPSVSKSLETRLEADLPFRNEIAVWAVKQGIAGDTRSAEFAASVARQIVYRLLGKILFYQSLRRSFRHLPDLDFRGSDTSQVMPTLRRAFTRALEIDYHAVFAEDVPDRIQWPSEASRELASLIHDFRTRDFSNVPQDVVGTVFERLIPPEDRHGFGQYFTPENLCDLIVGFCVRSATDNVLDPTCGTGTFLIRAYDRLRSLGQANHVNLLSQTWGVDIAPFPAELATINLFRQRVAEHANFPRIVCQDAFAIAPGQQFRFPPPKVDVDRPEVIEHALPMFDAIVGNFPFIRQEKIEKLVPGYKRQIEQVIAQDWFDAYPDAFTFRSARYQKEFDRCRKLKLPYSELREHAELKLSGKADILAYLFFHIARFVAPGGRMGIITSNAWLDVDYGHELQQFLLDNFKIIAVLESRCEPWFTEADINTVATILEKCESERERDDHLVKFVRVKKPLAELLPGSAALSTPERWAVVQRHAARIERAAWKDRKTRPFKLRTDEDEDFRIRSCRQGELRAEITETGRTAKWGLQLRAPAVFFDVVQHWRQIFGESLSALGNLLDVESGIPTRINEFFYLGADDAQARGIEDCYLFPVVKSTRSSEKIKVSLADIDARLFLCNVDKATLERKGHKGALRYIEWGETQTTADGIPWSDGPSVRNRQPGWWALGQCQLTQICWTRFIAEKCYHLFSDVPVFADNALYIVHLKQEIEPRLAAAILNSTLFALFQELFGRTSLGGGLLQIFLDDLRPIPIPDLKSIDRRSSAKIIKLFDAVAERPVLSVFAEMERADRQALDDAVLSALALDPKTQRGAIYDAVAQLVRERGQLGRARNKERKTRSRGTRAEKEVVEAVLEEVIPDGPRRFPGDFYSPMAASSPKASMELPEELLIFDQSPLFTGVHTADDSFSRSVKPPEGKYLIYAQRAGHRSVDIPEKMVEVTRTVANYEKHLRELRGQLYEAFFRRTLDTRAAERLTQAAFDRFRLPTPESIG